MRLGTYFQRGRLVVLPLWGDVTVSTVGHHDSTEYRGWRECIEAGWDLGSSEGNMISVKL